MVLDIAIDPKYRFSTLIRTSVIMVKTTPVSAITAGNTTPGSLAKAKASPDSRVGIKVYARKAPQSITNPIGSSRPSMMTEAPSCVIPGLAKPP